MCNFPPTTASSDGMVVFPDGSVFWTPDLEEGAYAQRSALQNGPSPSMTKPHLWTEGLPTTHTVHHHTHTLDSKMLLAIAGLVGLLVALLLMQSGLWAKTPKHCPAPIPITDPIAEAIATCY